VPILVAVVPAAVELDVMGVKSEALNTLSGVMEGADAALWILGI
jgi:hypothetical protein